MHQDPITLCTLQTSNFTNECFMVVVNAMVGPRSWTGLFTRSSNKRNEKHDDFCLSPLQVYSQVEVLVVSSVLPAFASDVEFVNEYCKLACLSSKT